MISKEEQRIYNNYMISGRKANNKPFNPRKNFDDLDEEICSILVKMRQFFEEYPHINQEIYFMAPYKMFPETTYYDLSYFATAKARKAYSLYIKKLELEDPDSVDSLSRLQAGFKFVLRFCEDRALTLEEYVAYCEGSLPCFVEHLKNHHINFYTLHGLTISKINIDSRILDFLFEDFYGVFQKTKNKFYASKKMKEFATKAKQTLKTKLN